MINLKERGLKIFRYRRKNKAGLRKSFFIFFKNKCKKIDKIDKKGQEKAEKIA